MPPVQFICWQCYLYGYNAFCFRTVVFVGAVEFMCLECYLFAYNAFCLRIMLFVHVQCDLCVCNESLF